MSDAINGIRAWTAMFGDGGRPVPRDLAESRASVCAVCPLNETSAVFTPIKAAAQVFTAMLEIKHREDLTLPNDNELGVCKPCWCPLTLKPWSPIHVIIRDMTQERINQLHEKCWIRTEINEPHRI